MNHASAQPFNGGVQLLAVCPALAVTDTFLNALGMSAVVLVALPVSTAIMTITRRWLAAQTQLIASMLVVACAAAAAQLLLVAWLPALHDSLGVFLPLIVANVIILEHLRAPSGPAAAIRASLRTGGAIVLILLPLGVARELVGHGSLLHDAARVLGPWAGPMQRTLFRVDMGFLLAMLPPGAFLAAGFLFATRSWLARRQS